MRFPRYALAGWLLAAAACGCGSGNPNEREYLEHAPPGKKSDDPEDQKVSHRRQRTLNETKKPEKKTAGKAGHP